jgi:adenylate kinase
MNIIIVGPPGAGKGTQADRLADWLGLPHVASGEFFRAELRAGSPMGLEAKAFIDRGALVPDDLTTSMILERLSRPDCAKGFLLDGYPRTLPQARSLDAAFAAQGAGRKIGLVLRLTATEDTVLHRMADRISCSNCGKVYNLRYSPPRVEGICDRCGHTLYVRSDDKPATYKKRLQIYRDETWPMIEYYAHQGLVQVVDGELDPDAVFHRLQEAIVAQWKPVATVDLGAHPKSKPLAASLDAGTPSDLGPRPKLKPAASSDLGPRPNG